VTTTPRSAHSNGDDAIWLAVSHGDVIKAILADALGMHLDQFQRLVVDPCSVSVIRFTPLRPFAVRINDSGTDLAALPRFRVRNAAPAARGQHFFGRRGGRLGRVPAARSATPPERHRVVDHAASGV